MTLFLQGLEEGNLVPIGVHICNQLSIFPSANTGKLS